MKRSSATVFLALLSAAFCGAAVLGAGVGAAGVWHELETTEAFGRAVNPDGTPMKTLGVREIFFGFGGMMTAGWCALVCGLAAFRRTQRTDSSLVRT